LEGSLAENHLFYGRNVFREAVVAGVKITEIYYANDQAQKFLEEFKNLRAPRRANLPPELRSVVHQGIAFRAAHEFYLQQWDLKHQRFPFILLCNHLEDVQNLGSLTRAAAAFGVGLIVHEERRSARMNEVGLKVSAGQAFRMKFLEVSNLTPFCKKLADEGYVIVGLDAGADAIPLYNWTPEFPLALIVGSESAGISKPVRGQVHSLISVPMKGDVESLNATQATAIAMSWIYRSMGK
jgi:23S rRNA (guanosine2251-2'-O)-methyltransferase